MNQANTSKNYLTAPQSEQYWHRSLPVLRGKKMQLLTIGGICVVGQWYGDLGQAFVAWAPLLKDEPQVIPVDYTARLQAIVIALHREQMSVNEIDALIDLNNIVKEMLKHERI